jgi:hypothetical protein
MFFGPVALFQMLKEMISSQRIAKEATRAFKEYLDKLIDLSFSLFIDQIGIMRDLMQPYLDFFQNVIGYLTLLYPLQLLFDVIMSTINAIYGFTISAPAKWTIKQIEAIINWLVTRTTNDWLTFLSVVLFWPIILIVYIVQSLIELFKKDPS